MPAFEQIDPYVKDRPPLMPMRVNFVYGHSEQVQSFSYPYSHMGYVALVSQGEIQIQCLCGKIERIVIRGHHLGELYAALDDQTLTKVQQSAAVPFGRRETIVSAIECILPQPEE